MRQNAPAGGAFSSQLTGFDYEKPHRQNHLLKPISACSFGKPGLYPRSSQMKRKAINFGFLALVVRGVPPIGWDPANKVQAVLSFPAGHAPVNCGSHLEGFTLAQPTDQARSGWVPPRSDGLGRKSVSQTGAFKTGTFKRKRLSPDLERKRIAGTSAKRSSLPASAKPKACPTKVSNSTAACPRNRLAGKP